MNWNHEGAQDHFSACFHHFLLQDITKAVVTQNDVTEITFFFGNWAQTRFKMDPGEISKVRIKGTNWDYST